MSEPLRVTFQFGLCKGEVVGFTYSIAHGSVVAVIVDDDGNFVSVPIGELKRAKARK